MSRPYVDGGVDAAGSWLGRVQVFCPGQACLECAWSDKHYRHVARETPCNPPGEMAAVPTLAPALLGTTVAGVMAAEGVKILLGHMPATSVEITLDLASRRWTTSRMRRAARCRFDHQAIGTTNCLANPFAVATVGDLLAAVHQYFGAGEEEIQLELRRGLVNVGWLGNERFVCASQLARLNDRRLAELHLTADDYIRAVCGDVSAYFALRPYATPSRTEKEVP
jgi:hypothetical protein